MKNSIYKYTPDFFIFTGIGIFSYFLLSPQIIESGSRLKRIRDGQPYIIDTTVYKVLGILLITIGIDILIRKYLKSKNQ